MKYEEIFAIYVDTHLDFTDFVKFLRGRLFGDDFLYAKFHYSNYEIEVETDSEHDVEKIQDGNTLPPFTYRIWFIPMGYVSLSYQIDFAEKFLFLFQANRMSTRLMADFGNLVQFPTCEGRLSHGYKIGLLLHQGRTLIRKMR